MKKSSFMIPLLVLIVIIIFISNYIQQELSSKAEIKVREGDVEMVISPSDGNVISGVVKINLTKVPEDTKVVGFVIQGHDIPDIKETGPNLGIDTDGSDGWSTELDTAVYSDNTYTIAGITSAVGIEEEGTPTGAAQVQVVIKNEGVEGSVLEPPAEIKFYKGVQLWPTETNKERIVESKDMGANVVVFVFIADYKDKVVLPKDRNPYLTGAIREAYRNGLAVSLAVLFPSDIDKKYPYREGSTIDLPPGYDVTPFIDNMKEVYREIAIFAEENKVHSIAIPIEIEAWIGRIFENRTEYWEKSGKINQEVTSEIRKHFKGKVIGEIMGGMWGFDAPCCYTNVPIDAIDISVFDVIAMPTSSDYRITGSSLGYVDEGLKRIEFTRKVMDRDNVETLYVGVGGYPIISPWQGDRVALYSEFFEKSQGKVDGYTVTIFPQVPESYYDTKSVDAARIWYGKT